MAREATITQEQVNAVADAIRAEGQKPTARAIRERLGNTGSMATVLKFLQVWQANQVKPAAQDVTLPPALTRFLVDFVGQEVSNARADLQADLVTVQQAQADLIAESERQASTIESQAEALELAAAEKAEAAGKLGQMESDLATARDEAARERQAAEAARTELAKAQLRLEAMPILEKENERLQGALDVERSARAGAERQAAAAEAKAEGLAARLADTQEQQRTARGEIDRLRAELEAERTARASAERQAAAAEAKAEGLAGNLTDCHEQIHQAQADAHNAREALAKANEQLAVAQAARAAEAAQAGKLAGTIEALEKQLAAVGAANATTKASPKGSAAKKEEAAK